MGGGFGGCTINLLKKTVVENVIEKLSKAYLDKFGIALTPYQVSVSERNTFLRLIIMEKFVLTDHP